MTRSYYNEKYIIIENSTSQIVCFDKQKLFKNDTNNHEINSIPKSTKK